MKKRNLMKENNFMETKQAMKNPICGKFSHGETLQVITFQSSTPIFAPINFSLLGKDFVQNGSMTNVMDQSTLERIRNETNQELSRKKPIFTTSQPVFAPLDFSLLGENFIQTGTMMNVMDRSTLERLYKETR